MEEVQENNNVTNNTSETKNTLQVKDDYSDFLLNLRYSFEVKVEENDPGEDIGHDVKKESFFNDSVKTHNNENESTLEEKNKSVCRTCFAPFDQKNKTGIRQLVCNDCFKSLSKANNNKNRIEQSKHSGQKPKVKSFSCEVCAKSFSETGVMKHLLLNTVKA